MPDWQTPTPIADGWEAPQPLPAQDPTLMDRFLNAYRGSSQEGIAGSIARHVKELEGYSPDQVNQASQEIKAEADANAAAHPWYQAGHGLGDALDGVATLAGHVLGSPEYLIPAGRGSSILGSAARQAAMGTAVNAGDQALDVNDGVRKTFDPVEALQTGAMAGGLGALHDAGATLLGKLTKSASDDVPIVKVDAGPAPTGDTPGFQSVTAPAPDGNVTIGPDGRMTVDIVGDNTRVNRSTGLPDPAPSGPVPVDAAAKARLTTDQDRYDQAHNDLVNQYQQANGLNRGQMLQKLRDDDAFRGQLASDAGDLANRRWAQTGEAPPPPDGPVPGARRATDNSIKTIGVDETGAINLTHTTADGTVVPIRMGLEPAPDGKGMTAEVSVDPFGSLKNKLGVGEIRQAMASIKEQYPEITSFAGFRRSGAGAGRVQEVSAAKAPEVKANSPAAEDGGIGPAATLGFQPKGEPGISVTNDDHLATAVYRDSAGTPKGVVQLPLSDEANDIYGGISSYVSPELRRQGIGNSLYKALKDAGHPIDEKSGTGDLTPDGAAFVNARKGRVQELSAVRSPSDDFVVPPEGGYAESLSKAEPDTIRQGVDVVKQKLMAGKPLDDFDRAVMAEGDKRGPGLYAEGPLKDLSPDDYQKAAEAARVDPAAQAESVKNAGPYENGSEYQISRGGTVRRVGDSQGARRAALELMTPDEQATHLQNVLAHPDKTNGDFGPVKIEYKNGKAPSPDVMTQPPSGRQPPASPPSPPPSIDPPEPNPGEPREKYQGNINVEKLTDDPKFDKYFGEAVKGANLDPQTHSATQDLARKLLDENSPIKVLLDSRRARRGDVPAYDLATRVLFRAAGEKVGDLAEKVADPTMNTDAVRTELEKWMLVLQTAGEEASSNAKHAGRTLNAFNIRAGDDEAALAKAVEKLARMNDGKDITQVAESIARLKSNPQAVAALVKSKYTPGMLDWAQHIWFNMALSGLHSAVKNFSDGGLNFLWDLGEHQSAVAPGLVRGGVDRVTQREIAARIYGAAKTFTDLSFYQNIAKAYKEGHPVTGRSKVEEHHMALPKPWTVLEYGPRNHAAADQFWRSIIKNSDYHGLAVRYAIKEGYKGRALGIRAADLVANPPEQMVKDTNAHIHRLQFVDDPSKLAKAFQGLKTRKPGDSIPAQIGRFAATMVAPFPRVADSIARTMIRRSPLGFLDAVNKADIAAGGARRDLAFSRIGLGSAAIGLFATMAAHGMLTGSGPGNYQKAQELMGSGWRPNSAVIGGVYHDISGTTVGLTANAVADAVEKFKSGELSHEGFADKMLDSFSSVGKSLSDLEWFKGVGDFLQGLQPGPMASSARKNYVATTLASMVNPAGVREAAGLIDPQYHDTTGDGSTGERFLGRVESGTPFLSRNLPIKYDVYGNPLSEQGAAAKADPVVKELARLAPEDKTLVGPVPKFVKKDGFQINLDAEQHQSYQRMAGQSLVESLRPMIGTKSWNDMNDDQRRKVVKSIKRQANAAARDALFLPAQTGWAQPQ